MPDTYYWVARGQAFARVDDVRRDTEANGRKGYPEAFFKQAGQDGLLLLADGDCFCMTGGRGQIQRELGPIGNHVIRLAQAVGTNRVLAMWAYREKVHVLGDRVTAIMIAPGPYGGVPPTMKQILNPGVSFDARGPDDPPWGGTVELRKIAQAIDWIES